LSKEPQKKRLGENLVGTRLGIVDEALGGAKGTGHPVYESKSLVRGENNRKRRLKVEPRGKKCIYMGS